MDDIVMGDWIARWAATEEDLGDKIFQLSMDRFIIHEMFPDTESGGFWVIASKGKSASR